MLGVSVWVRGVLTVEGTRGLDISRSDRQFCYYIQTENTKCSDRIHCANIFRMGSSISSFAQDISRMDASIEFLPGIMSLSVEYNRLGEQISEYVSLFWKRKNVAE